MKLYEVEYAVNTRHGDMELLGDQQKARIMLPDNVNVDNSIIDMLMLCRPIEIRHQYIKLLKVRESFTKLL